MASFLNMDFDTLAQNPIGGGSGLGTGGGSALGTLLAGLGGPLGAGLSAASSLFSFLGGGGQRSRQKSIYNSLGSYASQVGGMRGRLNPTNLYAQTVAGFQPQQRRFDQEMSRRFGFDSGQAGGFLARLLSEKFGALRPELEQQSAGFDLKALVEAANIKAQQGQYI
jgi:hypothetical protein